MRRNDPCRAKTMLPPVTLRPINLTPESPYPIVWQMLGITLPIVVSLVEHGALDA